MSFEEHRHSSSGQTDEAPSLVAAAWQPPPAPRCARPFPPSLVPVAAGGSAAAMPLCAAVVAAAGGGCDQVPAAGEPAATAHSCAAAVARDSRSAPGCQQVTLFRGLRIRVGIATGGSLEWVVGSTSGHQLSYAGKTMMRATKLAESGASGQVLCDEATRALVEGKQRHQRQQEQQRRQSQRQQRQPRPQTDARLVVSAAPKGGPPSAPQLPLDIASMAWESGTPVAPAASGGAATAAVPGAAGAAAPMAPVAPQGPCAMLLRIGFAPAAGAVEAGGMAPAPGAAGDTAPPAAGLVGAAVARGASKRKAQQRVLDQAYTCWLHPPPAAAVVGTGYDTGPAPDMHSALGPTIRTVMSQRLD